MHVTNKKKKGKIKTEGEEIMKEWVKGKEGPTKKKIWLKLYRQMVGNPVGYNCAPLVADLFWFCY